MIVPVLIGIAVLAIALLIWSYVRASGHAAVTVAGIDATLWRVSVAFVRFRLPTSGAVRLGWAFAYGPPETTRADVTAFAGLNGRVMRIDYATGKSEERVIRKPRRSRK
jgi:hypothetical protein